MAADGTRFLIDFDFREIHGTVSLVLTLDEQGVRCVGIGVMHANIWLMNEFECVITWLRCTSTMKDTIAIAHSSATIHTHYNK